MPEFIPVKRVIEEPTTIFISDALPYLEARKQTQDEAEARGLEIATMPQLIRLFKSTKSRDRIRRMGGAFADTASGEYHGVFEGDRVYAVAHGLGPLTGLTRLEGGWTERNVDGFIPISDEEFHDLMETQPHYHVSDIQRGEMPTEKYVVFLRLDKDHPTMHYSGQLDESDFMVDDIVLMRTGSMENRETLIRTLQSEGNSTFGNYHRINGLNYNDPLGAPLFLSQVKYGLNAGKRAVTPGRFIAVVPEGQTIPNLPLEKRVQS